MSAKYQMYQSVYVSAVHPMSECWGEARTLLDSGIFPSGVRKVILKTFWQTWDAVRLSSRNQLKPFNLCLLRQSVIGLLPQRWPRFRFGFDGKNPMSNKNLVFDEVHNMLALPRPVFYGFTCWTERLPCLHGERLRNRMGWHVSAAEAWHISRKKTLIHFWRDDCPYNCVFSGKQCDQDDVRQCKMFQVSSPLNSRVTSILGHELPEEPVIFVKIQQLPGLWSISIWLQVERDLLEGARRKFLRFGYFGWTMLN